MRQKGNGSAAKPVRGAETATSQSGARAVKKDWSVKVNVRLPHKIGMPLGSTSSSASDGSDGGGSAM